MRTLSSEIAAATLAMSQKGTWARLFEVTVDDTQTLYYTDYPKTVIYQSRAYTPYPIYQKQREETSKPENKPYSLVVGNLDLSFSSYIESGLLLGQKIKTITIFIRGDSE